MPDECAAAAAGYALSLGVSHAPSSARRIRWAGLVSGEVTRCSCTSRIGPRSSKATIRSTLAHRTSAGQRHARTRRRRDAANGGVVHLPGGSTARIYGRTPYTRTPVMPWSSGSSWTREALGCLMSQSQISWPFANTGSPAACHGRSLVAAPRRHSGAVHLPVRDRTARQLAVDSGRQQVGCHSQDTTHGDGRPSAVARAMAGLAQCRLWWRAALWRARPLLSWSIDRRNVCAVDLALTTGMRLTEWSTLLDAESPAH